MRTVASVFLILLLTIDRAQCDPLGTFECPNFFSKIGALARTAISNLTRTSERPSARALQRQVEAKLGYKIEIDQSPFSIEVKNSAGSEIGEFHFLVEVPERTNLYYGYIRVDEDAQRKGLSELMLARVLETNPQIKSIETSPLVETNREEILKALGENVKCPEAILRAPAAITIIGFGFTKVVDYECSPQRFRITLGK